MAVVVVATAKTAEDNDDSDDNYRNSRGHGRDGAATTTAMMATAPWTAKTKIAPTTKIL